MRLRNSLFGAYYGVRTRYSVRGGRTGREATVPGIIVAIPGMAAFLFSEEWLTDHY